MRAIATALLLLAFGASPLPGPPTFYRWIVPLQYDGNDFSVPKPFACDGPWDATPYVAGVAGAMDLQKNVVVKSDCGVPANTGCESPSLYVVAVAYTAHALERKDFHYASKSSFPAIAVAGPADPHGPWSFAPLHPGLTMEAGNGYAFFVACIVAV